MFKQKNAHILKGVEFFASRLIAFQLHISHRELQRKQECIPVECVPSAPVAVSGGGGMFA